VPYTHTTFGELKGNLAVRLSDSNNVFWSSAELGRHIRESLRVWGVLTAFWRERAGFATTASEPFYALETELPGLMQRNVTDRDLITDLLDHLMEPPITDWTIYPGTEMFTLSSLAEAVSRRRQQFLAETGVVVSRQEVAIPAAGRVDLPDTVIDVRRLVWRSVGGVNSHLWREDEWALTVATRGLWAVNPGVPTAYSVMAARPVEVQLAPAPSDAGTLDLVSVSTGPDLDPSTTPTVLGIPDDLAWVVKWGALADLLGRDGPARDSARSAFAESRYRQGVEIVRLLASVVTGSINGMPLVLDSLQALDAARVNWQNATPSTPTTVAMAGLNLLACHPPPDGAHSLILDVVRNTPLPSLDSDYVQLGREQLDAILDYAQHLASFKMGGAEFEATMGKAEDFLRQAMGYNERLAAAARYIVPSRDQARMEDKRRPRREVSASSLGALPPATPKTAPSPYGPVELVEG
jgi:hypothetical protein